jgi:uncharacterized damage-inducible protein DinB
MTAQAVLQFALASSKHVLHLLTADLSDADLLMQPAPNANHIAWQLGHLVYSEKRLQVMLPGSKHPDLPHALMTLYAPENPKSPEAAYYTKAEYLHWFDQQRDATIAHVSTMTEADLDTPITGPMASFAPTVGAMVSVVANHTMMHVGQFTVVRRLLGKPVIV